MADDELDPLNPQSWHHVPNVCGSCIAWRPDSAKDSDEIATGVCKLRPEINRVPADLKKCNRYMQRGGFVYEHGKGPVAPKRKSPKTISVLRQGQDGQLVRSTARPTSVSSSPRSEPAPSFSRPFVAQGPRTVVEDPAEVQSAPRTVRAPSPAQISLGEVTSTEVVRYAIIELVRQEHGRTRREIHPRFKGGKISAVNGARKQTIPAERFFSIVDRLRSSLDALDGAIGKLKDDELTQTVGRMHGSFTTFNVLFSERGDYFSSKE